MIEERIKDRLLAPILSELKLDRSTAHLHSLRSRGLEAMFRHAKEPRFAVGAGHRCLFGRLGDLSRFEIQLNLHGRAPRLRWIWGPKQRLCGLPEAGGGHISHVSASKRKLELNHGRLGCQL